MTPQEYCQDKAAKSGSSFYYSFLSLPEDKRNAIIAVYAFCREVDDIVDSKTDPQIKAAKINWWKDEVNNLYSGNPQHPISLALKPVINNFNMPEEYFQEVLDGMTMDLTQKRYASFKELSLYCYRVASVVGLMSAEIFGYQDRRTLQYANDLGMAFQLTNIIRDVYDDLQNDRIYIPGDELEKAPTPLNFQELPAETAQMVQQIEETERFFHWELEFPDVFNPQRKGFDAVLGNPPWENAQPNIDEFFSNVEPLFRTFGRLEKIDWMQTSFETPFS